MAAFLAAGLLIVMLGAALAWYIQVRNVEIARYEVLESDGDIEIRSYPALVAAEVVRTGSRDEAVRKGFRPLAGYIFASERPGEKIAMTAPVIQKSDGKGWTISFIMPSAHALGSLPAPSDPDVRLTEIPAQRRAAIRFSGAWSDELFAEKDRILSDWMKGRGLSPAGTPIYAYYNDPFTPGFLRRNEVLYDLVPH